MYTFVTYFVSTSSAHSTLWIHQIEIVLCLIFLQPGVLDNLIKLVL